MSSLDSKVSLVVTDPNPAYTPPSKLKTYGFIIAIIVGISGLAIGGIGAAGYFHVGALSNTTQIDAIIMMAAGGGGGVIFLIVGIIGAIKNRQPVSHQLRNDLSVSLSSPKSEKITQSNTSQVSECKGEKPKTQVKVNSRRRKSSSRKAKLTTKTGDISSVNTQGGKVYGPEAWPALGTKLGCKLKILDKTIPEAPQEDVAEGRVRIYIPQRVSVDGKKQELTLNNLIEMGGGGGCCTTPIKASR